MSGELRAVSATGRTVYAHILNSSAQRWNGTAFETFSAGDYSSYGVTVTEQGATGVYVGTFPTSISAGTYDVYHYYAIDGSAANGDPVVSTQTIVWDGTATVTSGSSIGSMTGSELYDYVLRTYKRTGKSTEIYEAITDTVNDMMIRFPFDEVSEETGTTASISSLGQYQINVESDLGLFVGNVVLLDGDNSWELKKLSKQEFDTKFPNQAAANVNNDKPRYWCFYGGKIWLGPVPDSTSYTYKLNQSQRLITAITSTVDPVPFSGLYRETLKFGTLARTFAMVEEYEKASFWSKAYEDQLLIDIAREKSNRRAPTVTEPETYGVY